MAPRANCLSWASCYFTGCQDCGAGVKIVCRQHGELTKVKDRVIPSRAKLTAPHHVSIKVIELRAGGKNGELQT